MRFVTFFLRSLGNIALGAMLACATILFAAAMWDIFDKPNLPYVRPLTAVEAAQVMRANREAAPATDQFGRLRGALNYLDSISPPISAWVRDRWESGKLTFETEPRRYGAAYMPVVRRLFIPVKTLDSSDEFLAELLAHEFRHSRQPILPGIQRDIAALIGLDREDLVEEQAVEFQERIHRAIRGQP